MPIPPVSPMRIINHQSCRVLRLISCLQSRESDRLLVAPSSSRLCLRPLRFTQTIKPDLVGRGHKDIDLAANGNLYIPNGQPARRGETVSGLDSEIVVRRGGGPRKYQAVS